MPKLQDVNISKAELIDFLDNSSDFAFELRCLKRLNDIGYSCRHGGSYTDPVTKKTRQFDIRADKVHEKLSVHCAIECKNLTDSFPLLVMCVPRAEDESFHDLMMSYHPDLVKQSYPRAPAFDKKCETIRVEHPNSVYAVGQPVGKSCAQVGKAISNDIVGTDAEVFEKWSQALASADDLADVASSKGEEENDFHLAAILAFVVVPDGKLWTVDYDETGNRTTDPTQTDYCSFFVGQFYPYVFMERTSLVVSHLEFVTLSGLETLLKDVLIPDNEWFPVTKLCKVDDEE